MQRISHSRLKELLDYDPQIGVFTRKVKAGKVRVGDVFGSINGHGYLHGWLDGRNLYKCHHLAWFWVHGEWPSAWLDHRDGDRTNNRINNLRLSDASLNTQNQRRRQRGYADLPLGVSRNGSGFIARIMVRGVTHRLGTFRDAETAGRAYLDAKRKLHAACTI